MYHWEVKDGGAKIEEASSSKTTSKPVIDVNPFVGCLGTARVDGDKSASAMLAGTHGGNVDVKELCKGTRVLLPVYAKGGLLFLGDLHAQQGHGEFMGGALEVSGEVDLSIRVVKRDAEKGEHPLTCPRFYASERRGVMAVAPTMEDAVGNGIAALVGWVSEAGTLAPVDAYAYVTQTCEVGFGGVSKACGYAVATVSLPTVVLPNLAIMPGDAPTSSLALNASAWCKMGTANVSDAMRSINLYFQTCESGFEPVLPKPCAVAGPAYTVRAYPGATWAMERAMENAKPGDVIVCDAGGITDVIMMGELMSTRMQARGVAGAIVDGSVRDCDGIRRIKFPVFSKGVVPRAGTFAQIGEVGITICLGRVPVNPGDWIVADEMGVVVVPRARLLEAYDATVAVYTKETSMQPRLEKGESFDEIVATM